MSGEDVPDSALAAVTEEKNGVEEKNGAAVTGEGEAKAFIKGKRKNEQEAQAKAGKQKGQLPKKRFYRARAHSNPLSDCQFSVPTMPSEFDWSESFPQFFSQEETTGEKGTASGDASGPADVEVGAVVAQLQCDESYGVQGQPDEESSDLGENLPVGLFRQYPIFITLALVKTGDVPPSWLGFLMLAVPSDEKKNIVGGLHPVCAEGKDLKVRFADIGCGFGGLVVQLSPLFPKSLMVGMELRDKVSEYVKERIIVLREQHPGQYENISVLRTNAMKYLPNYFEKGQLQKMFFLFPDPHFKEKNHRRRIISTALLAEYAYIMAVGGILYTVTDVQELGEWMKTTLDAHPLFQPLTDEELEKDVCVPLLTTATEEGQKVERNGGSTYKAIYRRIAGPGNSGP